MPPSNGDTRSPGASDDGSAFIHGPAQEALDGVPEEFLGVPDGFGPRRSQMEDGGISQLQDSRLHPLTASANPLGEPTPSSSRSKADEADDSFRLRHDASFEQADGPAADRGLYRSAGGSPSNPQPRLAIGLGPSLSTSGRDDSIGISSLSGPQHPYALYSQNTVPEGSPVSPLSPTSPAFLATPHLVHPGQENAGREQMQDVIGPDSCMEQLPPYSRYPNAPPPKDTTEQETTSPAAGTNPGDDVSPTAESTDGQPSLNNSQSYISTRTAVSDSSRAALNTASTPPNQRILNEKWRAAGKRRVCFGKLPVWGAILIIIIIVLVIAVVIGTVCGIMLGRRVKQLENERSTLATTTPTPSTIYTTATTIYGASPLHTPPPDLPGLPSGSYLLSMADAGTAETSCLTDSQQAPAWSCNLSVGQEPWIVIQITPKQPNTRDDLIQLSMPPERMRRMPLRYGTQPPFFDQMENLTLVTDQRDHGAGPAYGFRTSYDKLVILEESALGQGSIEKRAAEGSPPSTNPNPVGVSVSAMQQDTILQPRDRPWFCYWNNTILDGFIYVTKDALPTSEHYNSSDPNYNPSNPTGQGAGQTPPPFPKVFKLEDRRDPKIANDVKPYCQQMQVLDDGNLGTAPQPGSDGTDPIVIKLDEKTSSSVAAAASAVHARAKRSKRAVMATDNNKKAGGIISRRTYDNDHCICEWKNQ